MTSNTLDGNDRLPGDDVRDLYASFTRRLELEPEMSIDGMRDLFEQWHLATAEPSGVTYREVADAPVPATWCLPLGATHRGAIVYTHGGGFVVGSRHSHRKLAAHLAARSATPVLVIDYRRAPEHPHPAQLEDTISVAKWLMSSEGLSHRQIVFAGDSAGGNIAVSSGLQLSQEGLAPAAIVAMSPWFDMQNLGASLEENAPHDAMVNRPTLEAMTGLVLDGLAPQSPRANPLHADLSSLPPVLVTTSAHEALRDDATRFAEQAEAAGRDITLLLEPNAQHVFQMAAGRSRAADRSLEHIGEWVQAKFGSS